MSNASLTKTEQVVVQFGTRTLKGYLESPAWNMVEELLVNAPLSTPETLRIRHIGSDIVEEIPTCGIKAIFFVNTFQGNSEHTNLAFHSRASVARGIWIRLQFRDGEVMEGIVYNSLRYLIDPGFFLLPTDPDSNNKLVYVMKTWLVDHRVLGVRNLALPELGS